MCPNIIIGNIVISSWYALLLAGAAVSVALAVHLRPKDFIVSRAALFAVGIGVVIISILGARLLFIALHLNSYSFTLRDIFSYRGGFAYFGALVLSVAMLWLYTALRRINFLAFMDYAMPFLMLSQVFVRVGCLMAGCCYGKPTPSGFGATFKPVDTVLRHPTQAYEALLLIFIFLAGRYIYKKRNRMAGYTFFISLAAYGVGRFVIEYFRVDSPLLFLNLTLAQVTCLALAAISLIALRYSSADYC